MEIKNSFPERIFTQNILDSNLPEHVNNLLQEAGYQTVGDLAVQFRLNPDRIYRINGIGPKALSEINLLIDTLEAEMKLQNLLPKKFQLMKKKLNLNQRLLKPVVEEIASIEPEIIVPAIEEAQTVTEPEPEPMKNTHHWMKSSPSNQKC